jgi:hypothetical protein
VFVVIELLRPVVLGAIRRLHKTLKRDSTLAKTTLIKIEQASI